MVVGGDGHPPRRAIHVWFHRLTGEGLSGANGITGDEASAEIACRGLDLGAAGVEAGPVGVGVELHGRQDPTVTVDQVEVVLDRRVDQPRTGPVMVPFVPVVEQFH